MPPGEACDGYWLELEVAAGAQATQPFSAQPLSAQPLSAQLLLAEPLTAQPLLQLPRSAWPLQGPWQQPAMLQRLAALTPKAAFRRKASELGCSSSLRPEAALAPPALAPLVRNPPMPLACGLGPTGEGMTAVEQALRQEQALVQARPAPLEQALSQELAPVQG